MGTHNRDLNLEKDVTEFVKSKMKDIKNVDEIFLFAKFDLMKPLEGDESELYYQLNRSKKILQLTINIYNNFEIYKGFRVKMEPIDRDALSCYSSGDGGILQTCEKRPLDRDVAKALYNYVLYYLSLQMKDEYPSRADAACVPVSKCTFCDEDISSGADSCGVCCATVEDIRREMVKQSSKRHGRARENCRDRNPQIQNYETSGKKDDSRRESYTKSDRDEGGTSEGSAGRSADMKKDEMFDKKGDSRRESAMESDGNKDGTGGGYGMKTTRNAGDDLIGSQWKCGKCGYLNGDSMANCQACGDMNACATVVKEHRNAPHEGNGDSLDWTNKWQCKGCSLLQSFRARECGACGSGRAVRGSWKCGGCTLVNPCSSSTCAVCGRINELLVRRCRSCRKNGVNRDKDRCDGCVRADPGPKWWCALMTCGAMNSIRNDYCHECRLPRKFNLGRGITVQQKGIFFGSSNVWICHKCSEINPESRSACDKCRDTRFPSYCTRCRAETDGTLKQCSRCKGARS